MPTTMQPTSHPEEDGDTLPPGAERRTAPRYPSDLETSCQPLTARDGSSWPAQVRNISQGGIALALNRRFEPGTLLIMDLENTDQKAARTVLARVVHATALAEGGWLLGCALTSVLDDDDLEPFRAQRLRPSTPDCRAWVRFSCDVETSCQPASVEQIEPWAVKIVNISPGGLGLLTPAPVDVGTLLHIDLPAEQGRPGRTLPVRVVQPGKPAGQDWLLGCEFARQLNDEELRQLLG